MKVLDQLSIVKVGITSNAISASKLKYLGCIMKQTIYRLYTSSKQMKLASQLVTVLINSTERLQKPYVLVCTQLAIATKERNECRSYKLACTEQPYVCIQLAIATSKERIMRFTSKDEVKQMKQASYRWKAEKRARVNRLSAREKRWKYSSKSSLTSIKTCRPQQPLLGGSNERYISYVCTQLAIASCVHT